jgi:hypothetical protein
MTTAACLVFVGVLNYVAYRDIFERRSGNLHKQAAETQGVADPQLVRGTSFSILTGARQAGSAK